MSQKYVPSTNYGSRSKTLSRRMNLMKYVGRDITIHYKDGRVEKLRIHAYEGPYLLLLAPKSSLGHIGIQVDAWDIREDKGELQAYPRDNRVAPSTQSPVGVAQKAPVDPSAPSPQRSP
jgi:hypothetical protein